LCRYSAFINILNAFCLASISLIATYYYYYYNNFDYNVKFTGELKLSYSYVALSLKTR